MQGRLATGSLLVTCGQHVAQVGVIGALGLRFSPEELARWLQGGELTLPAPQPLHIRLEGDFAPGATAYDIALACAGKKEPKAACCSCMTTPHGGLPARKSRRSV